MSTQLSPQLFAILSALVEERFGLHYGPADAGPFSDKLTARAAEAGFDNVFDYYYFLRYDAAAAAELHALADALVVGETYFFRELEPLRAGIDQAVVPAVKSKGRARVWCAASATGEEPLSVAMLLEEAGILGRCEIIATDLSAQALGKAREAVYGTRSMRALPPNPPSPAFTERLAGIAEASIVPDGGKARVVRTLVDAVDYRQVNLLDAEVIRALGTFDLVVCRNVLIYFADPTVKPVVASLAAALAPEGRLLIGASESLLRFGTALRCEERGGSFLYASPLASAGPGTGTGR